MQAIMELRHHVPPPHGGQPVLIGGTPPDSARAAIVLAHGRGAAARDILELHHQWQAAGFAFVAPQAADFTWYPEPFLAPFERNEPQLSSGLALFAGVVEELEARGLPVERQILLGFSQGGCLTLEFAARNARRWGGVVGLSAGLIGPLGRRWDFTGSLAGTPVFLGCGDTDPHIPRERLEESAVVLERLGGNVELQVYPGLGHAMNREELDRVQSLIALISAGEGAAHAPRREV